jgi:hypothetical protein
LIKWNWFQFYDEPPVWKPGDRIIVSWDTALSERDLASYSVCVVLQIRGETIFTLYVVRERLEQASRFTVAPSAKMAKIVAAWGVL